MASALAISSTPMQMLTLEPLTPPYASGKGMPRMPLSAKRRSMSLGYSRFSSISEARGTTFSCTSSRMVSRMANCSGLNRKSILGVASGQIIGADSLQSAELQSDQCPELQGKVVLEVRNVELAVHKDRQQRPE